MLKQIVSLVAGMFLQNIGMRTGGLVGWSASAYKGSENGIEDTTTHTGTHVVGTNNVSIESGSNTNLIGSTVSGQGVTAKVGNNLTVESFTRQSNLS